MAEIKKMPEIRFKYFSDIWSIEKFESLTKINQGLQIAISQRYTEEVDGGYFYITNEFLKESSNSKYYILNPPESVLCNHNDVLMTRTGNTGVVVTNISGAFHNNFFKIKFNEEKIEKNFLVTFLRLPKTQKIILASAGASTIPDLNHGAFYNIEITYPNLTEQGLLGSYFQHLDKLISLHQTKVNKLTNLKKAMLEKMFPQQGEDVPEIRFKGFAGAWDEVNLGEIANVTTGKLDANAMKDDGEFDFYTSGIQKYKIDVAAFIGPAITIAGNGATVGYMHLADGQFNAYQRTYVLTAFEANREFLFRSIGNVLPLKISQEARTGNIPYIVLDMLTELKLLLPSLHEQEKIGTYFQNLDKTIDLHQTELEKLTNLKKACLEKMFV